MEQASACEVRKHMNQETILLLLREAERCRRIARSINDDVTSARLIELAEQYEAEANAKAGLNSVEAQDHQSQNHQSQDH
jgi:flagellar motor switch protein FliG